ncbi:tumor protein p53-inducible nuclear protein 1-like [Macrosteles quadrilineatus]|uniref:tumor protein p53-inducible nuclear protein 1-like n=1 Tax=Macrosteles quadrilineatus TaxID=74068 RepID=UPI0023E280D0|nr:tumor protein p53-inducible nuclear protein 1-like [Macrosteles quadrilineatus]
MLTNLASYLLGYLEAPPAPAELDSAAQRLSGAPATPPVTPASASGPPSDDDEWLLVNAVGTEDEENVAVVRISRSASMSSLPCCPAMEDSWFLTPPPCFTSTAPSPLETNPLENLLIEHPSMSVYHGVGRGVRARSASPASSTAPSLPPAPRQPLAPVTDQHTLRCLELKAATKFQKKQSLTVNRNQLERNNKAREVNSRGRRQRRSDRQQQHSGANNNRKCC